MNLCVEAIDLNKTATYYQTLKKLCSVLKGSITIGNDSWSRKVNAGESFILPSAEHYVGGCNLYGEATILEAFVK